LILSFVVVAEIVKVVDYGLLRRFGRKLGVGRAALMLLFLDYATKPWYIPSLLLLCRLLGLIILKVLIQIN